MRNLNNNVIETLGIIKGRIQLKPFGDTEFEVDLFVLSDNTFEEEMILGRDFLRNQEFTLVYSSISPNDQTKANLFDKLLLCER